MTHVTDPTKAVLALADALRVSGYESAATDLEALADRWLDRAALGTA